MNYYAMAKATRPIFIAWWENTLFTQKDVEFERFMWLASEQKKKSVRSFHSKVKEQLWINQILEISTKSDDPLWIALSAFNLRSHVLTWIYTVESIFQWSKVFITWWPYEDFFTMHGREIKKDQRYINWTKLIEFKLLWEIRPLYPSTAFYDWLYVNALILNKELWDKIMNYSAFTDIEFNPTKKFNCQAKSASLFVGLKNKKIINDSFISKDEFITITDKWKQNSNSLF